MVQGFRVAGFKGCRVPKFQGSRVPEFQGSVVSEFQGSRVLRFQQVLSLGSRVPGFIFDFILFSSFREWIYLITKFQA